MATVRAKFKCIQVEDRPGADGIKDITLEAVINGSPENEQFFKWTPSGRLTLGCVNPEANAIFVDGNEYYVDVSPAEITEQQPSEPAPEQAPPAEPAE